ncbi:MAG: Zn-ribbon domain-containing OB-fold protein [Deltaproteobacteria bacterium]|nr:MAG: Zn-ribbon domain-containing OB-fold protein [Deltaproteobacteria bacterium]
MEKQSEIIRVTGLPVAAGYNWSAGSQMEGFIKALAKKKIMGAKCSKCGYTYVPPRSRCGKCNAKIEDKDLVEISGKGSLVGYTTARVELDGAGNFQDLKKPKMIGAIKLEGSDSTIFMPIEGIDPKKAKEGMKVKVQWREKAKGELADIVCFKPEKS